jgi:hypothetical protein
MLSSNSDNLAKAIGATGIILVAPQHKERNRMNIDSYLLMFAGFTLGILTASIAVGLYLYGKPVKVCITNNELKAITGFCEGSTIFLVDSTHKRLWSIDTREYVPEFPLSDNMLTPGTYITYRKGNQKYIAFID